MSIPVKEVSRQVFVLFRVMLLQAAMLLLTIAFCGCEGSTRSAADIAKSREGTSMGYVAGEYVNRDGTIFLEATGTYHTINDDGNTTSGTYNLVENQPNAPEGAHDWTIQFHQTSPEAVEGTAILQTGIIMNSYGWFVKR